MVAKRHYHSEIGVEDMSKDKGTTQAGRRYAAAHAAHYATKDFTEALGLYKGVMAEYPDTQEADYSRTQIHNIAKSVVPDRDILAAETEMTLVQLSHDRPSGGEHAAVAPLASEPAG